MLERKPLPLKLRFIRKGFAPKDVLRDWQTLISKVQRMTEDEVKVSLEYEVKHGKRQSFIVRLHRKYNRLRVARERAEYLQ